ncbi:MAG: PKD-like domain-containing protein, partial [Dolichospermum sp.]
VTYGTVTGRTANGTGNITDNLVVTTPANDSAVVRYTITPTANSCAGEPFVFTATIYPTPSLTVNPINSSICSFQTSNIGLSSNVPYATYNWTWNPSVPQITGGSNQSNQSVAAIQQTLTNTSTLTQNATYTINANGLGGCNSGTQVATVTISAAPTIALAGRDTILCNQTTYNLIGNTATSGSPTWSQIGSTPNVAGGLPANVSTVNATGLVGGVYQFEYVISSGIPGCPASRDTVFVTNRPAVTTSNAGADTAYCEY